MFGAAVSVTVSPFVKVAEQFEVALPQLILPVYPTLLAVIVPAEGRVTVRVRRTPNVAVTLRAPVTETVHVDGEGVVSQPDQNTPLPVVGAAVSVTVVL